MITGLPVRLVLHGSVVTALHIPGLIGGAPDGEVGATIAIVIAWDSLIMEGGHAVCPGFHAVIVRNALPRSTGPCGSAPDGEIGAAIAIIVARNRQVVAAQSLLKTFSGAALLHQPSARWRGGRPPRPWAVAVVMAGTGL